MAAMAMLLQISGRRAPDPLFPKGVLMLQQTEEQIQLNLRGDWTIAGIKAQWSEVFFALTRLKTDFKDQCLLHGIVVGMGGVTALDACGCQLLMILMHNLRELGVQPCIIHVQEEQQRLMASLGFGFEFCACEAA
jgi:ABC-type transporter Mla MlaB component